MLAGIRIRRFSFSTGLARILLISGAVGLTNPVSVQAQPSAKSPTGATLVRLETQDGNIDICVYGDAAPHSAASFLDHVSGGHFDAAGFYRVVRFDNDRGSPKINVIQGGLLSEVQVLPPVPHETTASTGISHTDGVISLARAAPGTGSGSAFFISIGANPSLDVGGARNPDGQGFASFGRVVAGMQLVRDIQALPAIAKVDDPYVLGQILAEPVMFSASIIKSELEGELEGESEDSCATAM